MGQYATEVLLDQVRTAITVSLPLVSSISCSMFHDAFLQYTAFSDIYTFLRDGTLESSHKYYPNLTPPKAVTNCKSFIDFSANPHKYRV